MLDRARLLQYRAFCDSLKDSLTLFEVWESVQAGMVAPNVFAAQLAKRLKGEPDSPQDEGAKAKGSAEAPKASSKPPSNERSNWGPVRDRTLQVLRTGAKRCRDVVAGVIQLSPEHQRPAGPTETKGHYRTVFNALTAMLNQRLVTKDPRPQSDGKVVPFWSITEEGRTYLTELGE